jgi:hypothetical protein
VRREAAADVTAFDQDVEISVKPHSKRAKTGRINFIPAA